MVRAPLLASKRLKRPVPARVAEVGVEAADARRAPGYRARMRLPVPGLISSSTREPEVGGERPAHARVESRPRAEPGRAHEADSSGASAAPVARAQDAVDSAPPRGALHPGATLRRDVAEGPSNGPATAGGRGMVDELSPALQGENESARDFQRNAGAGDPEGEARLGRVLSRVEGAALQRKAHPPAGEKVRQAHDAAVSPANERLGHARSAHIAAAEGARVERPDRDAFVALLRSKLEEIAPRDLDGMDRLPGSGSVRAIGGVAGAAVRAQEERAVGDLRARTGAEPDASGVQARDAHPLAEPERAGPTPAIGAAEAIPGPRPADEVSLESSRAEVERQMAEHGLDDEQLARANDPRFEALRASRAAVDAHAASAPAAFSMREAAELEARRAAAGSDERRGLAGMLQARSGSFQRVHGAQRAAQERDEAARQAVADRVEAIFERARRGATSRLESLSAEVDRLFEQGESAARQQMEMHVRRRLDAYRAARYAGADGALRWARDLFLGLPDEVRAFYVEARTLYLARMDRAIEAIADTVEARLRAAREEIARGRQEIEAFITSLPESLREVGRAAADAVSGRFDELEKSVDRHRDELAASLAQRYREARDRAESLLEEMRAEHRGLVDRFTEALGAVVEVLRSFRDRFLGMVAEARDVIGLILADPIQFLAHLVRAIRDGVGRFSRNVLEHLRAGFFAWLFGTLESAGIRVPRDFGLPSIFGLVLEILGITYQRLRQRVVRLIGERNVELVERAWGVIAGLIGGGLGGLWERAREFLGNLREILVDSIQNWVVTRVVQAAITRLVSMLNPVGALVQAILAIYNTVQFFVQRIAQIASLVQAILGSVGSIARGALGAAVEWIERSLARAIPVAIGFLASLLGLGGLAERIRSVVQQLQARVERALDRVIGAIVRTVGRLLRPGSGLREGEGEQRRADAPAGPDERTGEEKRRDLDAAVEAAEATLADPRIPRSRAEAEIEAVRPRHRLQVLQLVVERRAGFEESVRVRGEVNPERTGRQIRRRTLPDPPITLTSEVGPPIERQGLERTLPRPGLVGLPGFHRAHAVGPGTGAELEEGISYAPAEVNLSHMNQGVERFIRELREEAPPGVEIWQRVGVRQVGRTGRLESITYHIFARQGEEQRLIVEATIRLDYARDPRNPKVIASVEPVGALLENLL